MFLPGTLLELSVIGELPLYFSKAVNIDDEFIKCVDYETYTIPVHGGDCVLFLGSKKIENSEIEVKLFLTACGSLFFMTNSTYRYYTQNFRIFKEAAR